MLTSTTLSLTKRCASERTVHPFPDCGRPAPYNSLISKRPMLYTSGQKQRPRLAQQVYRFMLDQEPLLGAATVTVHHRRLTSEGVVGWQQEDGQEFLVEVERDLPKADYILTLIHELIHCRQTLEGIMDEEQRETEAYGLETVYAARFAAA